MRGVGEEILSEEGLVEWLRGEVGRWGSAACYAERSGVSRSQLSEVLGGKRAVSGEMGRRCGGWEMVVMWRRGRDGVCPDGS